MNTTAKKLTLDEIKELPVATIIWRAYVIETDEGIVWHGTVPAMICVPGKGGYFLGGDEAGAFDYEIDDHLTDDQSDSYWDSQPADDQLPGITKQEYDDLKDEEHIMLSKLAKAITYRRYTFEAFCEMTGLNYAKFWNAITGNREFTQHEIVTIRTVLDLTDDEVMKIFFPAALAQI